MKKIWHQYPETIFLLAATLFIRFPFFFRDYIDKDESTFILMGQSIADGHLPYAHLWDLKPPLLFYLFALVERIFPHSFAAIRLLGVIIVFLSALLLRTLMRRHGLKNAFPAALAYVLLSSEFGSLQGVMSEHFAVFFLLAGLIFFLKPGNNYQLFLSGLAFGCALLCKLNYGYAIAILLLVFFVRYWKKNNLRGAIAAVIASGTGIVLTIAVAALPFVMAGKMSLFVNSVFWAPLEYAKAVQLTWVNKLATTWWIIAVSLLVGYLSVKRRPEEGKDLVLASVALIAGTVYTFYSSGIVNGHYLVQLYPFFLLLLLGVLLPWALPLRWGIAALIVLALSVESLSEYGRLIRSRPHPETYRPTFEAVSELRKRKLDRYPIFFADYHIGYWLLGQYPLTKSSTHPSNLARPYLFRYFNDSNRTSLAELNYLLEVVRPGVIVSATPDLGFFPPDGPENGYFKKITGEQYKMVFEDSISHIFIWKRNSIP